MKHAEYSVAVDYMNGLVNKSPLPVEASFPASRYVDANAETVRSATEISSILTRHGLAVVTLGSIAVERHQSGQYNGRQLHDIDFALAEEQIDEAKKVLRQSGFTAWNERTILETVRNSGGGFGRVHNEGAASDKYRNPDTGLPTWLGMFSYKEKDGKTQFHEYYTVTEAKIFSAIDWLQSQDIPSDTRHRLDILKSQPVEIEGLEVIVKEFSQEGVDFWEILFSTDINEQDMSRRAQLGYQESDRLIEVKMTKEFPVPAQEYLGAKAVQGYGGDLSVFSLEGAFLLMDKYYPHYLGCRDKYVKSASSIRNSGLLDGDRLSRYERIFANRAVKHEPVRCLPFMRDIIQDPEVLSRQRNVSLIHNDEVFYPSLLFEGIHVKRR